ncbi:MAG TPA: TIM44-like domain-containing protein [Candidatus Ozemobacteraceae bacterium]|nr:TIM44-like domain-containing protein [Candidatus Ozemobacteraceae bacterium]
MILRKRFDAGSVRLKKVRRRSGFKPAIIGGFGILLLLCAVAAFARAGGGEGFSGGGGGSSGGGHHGGNGDSDLIFFLLELIIRITIEYPVIGIPLIIVIIAAFFAAGAWGANEGREQYVDHTIRRGIVAQDNLRRVRAETTLKSRDPAWNSVMMISRAKKAFALIQEAWSDQKLEKAQAFLSDAIYEKFKIQIAEMRDRGIRDSIESITLHDARIAQLQSDDAFDTLHIYFRADAKNYKIDAASGKRLSDDSGEFEEYWSFLRRPGATSLAGNGLIEGFCPSCSAPISMNRAATCEVCHSFLRSGEYDWVLSEITQSSAWTVREEPDIVGAGDLRKLDPGFSLQQMEDLASVAFYRHAAAMRAGNAGPIAKLALDSFTGTFAEKLRKEADGTRAYYLECAVGSVDTKRVELGDTLDRVWVEITWSGKNTRRTPDGREVVGGMSPPRRDFFIFVRKHGVETNIKLSLSSAQCPNCGAPEQDVADPVCPYCQAVRNDGSKGWVLQSILPADAAAYRKMILSAPEPRVSAAPESTPSLAVPVETGQEPVLVPEIALACMVHVMMADGVIDPREEKCLHGFAARCKLGKETVESMIQAARISGSAGISTLPIPENPEQGRQILRQMAAMALADGRLSTDELAALNAFATRISLSPADVKLIVNKERSRIYAEAKIAIAENKKNRS